MSQSITTSSSPIARPGHWTRLGVSIGIALVTNLAIYLVGNALINGAIQVANPSTGLVEDLPILAVAFAIVVPVSLGVAFLAAAERFWKIVPALVVVGVVTLLSLGAVFTLDVAAGSKVALTIMHLATGSAVIGTSLWGSE